VLNNFQKYQSAIGSSGFIIPQPTTASVMAMSPVLFRVTKSPT
jgi:hypothetical protein